MIEPGKRIERVTKTFQIPFRPSSISADEHRYMGSDALPHNGLAKTITFPVSASAAAGRRLVGQLQHRAQRPSSDRRSSPMDSLNVGVSPAVRVGHDRFPGGLFWDTRYDGFTGGSHFTLGSFGLDRDGHDGEVPAARFSTR